MASSLDYVGYVCEQIGGAGEIKYRKMFGEYGVYCDGKIIGLICDNRFFLKPTKAGAEICPKLELAPPYEGAKPYFVVDELDDRESVSVLVSATWGELPEPKPKKKNR